MNKILKWLDRRQICWLLLILFTTVVVWSAGVGPQAQLLFRLTLFGLLWIFFLQHRTQAQPLPQWRLIACWLALLLLQLVPLPLWLLHFLSPQRALLYNLVHDATGFGVTTLSLDPWLTLD